ncbi:hypothetical protein MKQ68_09860 [Chitinophaga horti]|uniref:Uncharacterized protein n=1 Tax=Chitinophaga horti TaxID=2920382 RepID=A0ABY6JAM8_9BACT|nr:hypothetical protein [Chitinophaga horti]UYQ95402.1 hypothetical protein MKQ68_09860 [Chitinophaga horti]
MSRLTKETVKKEVQQLAIGNYKSYPADYESEPVVVSENVRSLANGYWDCRSYKEVERDEKLGISLQDYQHWSKEAYEAYMQANRN